MLTLERIIEEEFVGVSLDHVVQKLSAHGLYSPITISIRQVNDHLINIKEELRRHGTLQVTHIATSLLIQVNEYLKGFNGRISKEKSEIKYLASSICKRLLMLITDKHPATHKALFIQNLMKSLKETCEFKGYDFQELVVFLGLDTLAYEKWVKKKGQDVIIPSVDDVQSFPGYVWNGNMEEGLERFIEIIDELKICPEPNQFKELFEHPMENLALELNRKDPPFVLQFFSCVWDSRLVTYQGCEGFYQVLQVHVKDFDSVFLKDKPMKRRLGIVREHKSYPGNRNRFDALLMQCVKPVL